MTDFLYDDYVGRLSERFSTALSDIEANHNFEYGNEFEVAVCEVLRTALPQQFGICRGYVVDRCGNLAGDDIIIYDRIRFPTMRAFNEEDYSRKERVPAEAVYAYIEAKHTLQLKGSGGSSITHAAHQAAAVKNLCNQRPIVEPGVSYDIKFTGGLKIQMPEGWPARHNPMYTAIWSRRVRLDADDPVMDDVAAIDRELLQLGFHEADSPDAILAGPSNLYVPMWQIEPGRWEFRSPFYIHERTMLYPRQCPNRAFGVSLALLLFALKFIHLGAMPWHDIVQNGLGFGPRVNP